MIRDLRVLVIVGTRKHILKTAHKEQTDENKLKKRIAMCLVVLSRWTPTVGVMQVESLTLNGLHKMRASHKGYCVHGILIDYIPA